MALPTADVAQQWREEDEKGGGPYYPIALSQKILDYSRPTLYNVPKLKKLMEQQWNRYLNEFKTLHPELEMNPIEEDVHFIYRKYDPKGLLNKFFGGFPTIIRGSSDVQNALEKSFSNFQEVNKDHLKDINRFLNNQEVLEENDRIRKPKEPEDKDPFAPEKGSEIGSKKNGGRIGLTGCVVTKKFF
jgi:hypothetical protein